jgi:hypothetical protein
MQHYRHSFKDGRLFCAVANVLCSQVVSITTKMTKGEHRRRREHSIALRRSSQHAHGPAKKSVGSGGGIGGGNGGGDGGGDGKKEGKKAKGYTRRDSVLSQLSPNKDGNDNEIAHFSSNDDTSSDDTSEGDDDDGDDDDDEDLLEFSTQQLQPCLTQHDIDACSSSRERLQLAFIAIERELSIPPLVKPADFEDDGNGKQSDEEGVIHYLCMCLTAAAERSATDATAAAEGRRRKMSVLLQKSSVGGASALVTFIWVVFCVAP